MLQITAKEASQILGISKRTLFRWEKEGIIRSTREGILNVRVYDRDYIVQSKEYFSMIKKILDLNKQIREHNAKLPEILIQCRKYQLEQVYFPAEPLKLFSHSDLKAMGKAYDNEEAWDSKHKRLNNEFGLLLEDFRRMFPDAPLKELLLKKEKSR